MIEHKHFIWMVHLLSAKVYGSLYIWAIIHLWRIHKLGSHCGKLSSFIHRTPELMQMKRRASSFTPNHRSSVLSSDMNIVSWFVTKLVSILYTIPMSVIHLFLLILQSFHLLREMLTNFVFTVRTRIFPSKPLFDTIRVKSVQAR